MTYCMWTNDGFFTYQIIIIKKKFQLSCKWKSPCFSFAAFRLSGSKVVIMMCKWCVGWHFFHYWDNVANECHCERLLNDWKPVGATQEDGDVDLLLPPCFISITQPALVFMYFCPSSGVNKTPCCRWGAWVMRLVPFESSAPSRSQVNLRDTGEMNALFEKFIYITFLCKCVYEDVHLCGLVTLAVLFSVTGFGCEIKYIYNNGPLKWKYLLDIDFNSCF